MKREEQMRSALLWIERQNPQSRLIPIFRLCLEKKSYFRQEMGEWVLTHKGDTYMNRTLDQFLEILQS